MKKMVVILSMAVVATFGGIVFLKKDLSTIEPSGGSEDVPAGCTDPRITDSIMGRNWYSEKCREYWSLYPIHTSTGSGGLPPKRFSPVDIPCVLKTATSTKIIGN